MTTPENPPAFTRPGSVDNFGDYPVTREAYDGMSLRDHFAGQAIVGLLAFPNRDGGKYSNKVTYEGHRLERLARFSYEIADAMLVARSKP